MDKTDDNAHMRKLLIDRGWITQTPEITQYLKNGYEEFELSAAQRIMEETPDQVFLNHCPKCHTLARTTYARQCRFCGHDWHDVVVAQFKLNRAFQVTNRPFFLLGQVTKGKIEKGHFMDLTFLGLNKRPMIEAIEYGLRREDGSSWEEVGLGTNELTEQDKAYLIKAGSLITPFDIIRER
ncbi:hypothetical protein [uncultured Chryseobacterium sp.]|uniref:hypothetical protein n=1 Tax=uncultured Chryseobacterium sp. TaxID=259322 RepID=UPI0025F2E7F1|nr:hypothetical protein [uncultured Chryseobacterium sp.]